MRLGLKITLLLALVIILWVNISLCDSINIRPDVGYVYYIPYNECKYQLHHLAWIAEYEDAWINVGDKWYDVGEVVGKEELVLLNYNRIIDLIKLDFENQTEIIMSHIHPIKYQTKDQIFPPSANDINVHARLKRLFRKRFRLELISEVYDGYGIWRYDVSRALEKDLHSFSEYGDGFHLLRLTLYMQQKEKEILQDSNLSRKIRIEKYIRIIEKQCLIFAYHDLFNPPPYHRDEEIHLPALKGMSVSFWSRISF